MRLRARGYRHRSGTRGRFRNGPRGTLILVLFTLLVGGGMAMPANAGHSWAGIHWEREDNPFTLKLGNNVNGIYNRLLNRVAGDWRRSNAVRVRVVGGKTNPRNCRATPGRVEVCNARYGNTGWLGIASVYVDGKHIRRASVLMNDTYFDSRDYDSNVARRHVLCQEIGHTLGLDHYRGQSCMDDRRGLFQRAFIRPSRHDYDQLKRIYRHTDNRTTVGSLETDGTEVFISEDEDAPFAAVAASGGADVIIEDLGGGHSRLTYVTWVDQYPALATNADAEATVSRPGEDLAPE